MPSRLLQARVDWVKKRGPMAKKKRKAAGVELVEPAELAGEDEEINGFEALLQLDPDGLLVVDPSTRQVLWANRAAARLLKSTPEALLEAPFGEELEDGPMRSFDLDKKVVDTDWNGTAAQLLTLTAKSKSEASFNLEWRLEAAEERAREAEEQNGALQKQVRELRKQVKAAGSAPAAAAAPATLPSSPERERELQAELDRSLERLENTEGELRNAERRADLAEERAQQAERLMEEAESQSLETERQLEDLNDTVRLLEEQLEAGRSSSEVQASPGSGPSADEWQAKTRELEELEEAHLQLMTELEQVRFELSNRAEESAAEAHSVRLAELEALLKEAGDARTAAQAEADTLQSDFEDLNRHLLQVEKERDDLLASLEAAEASSEAVASALERAEQAEAKLEKLEASLGEASSERDQLRSLVEVGSSSHTETRAALDAAETARAMAEARVTELEAAGDEMRALRDELQVRLDAAADEASDVARHLTDVESERDDLLAQLDTAEAAAQELVAVREELDALTSERDGLLALHDEASRLAESLQAELESLRSERDALRQQLGGAEQQLSEQLEQAQARLLEREAELAALRAELQEQANSAAQTARELQGRFNDKQAEAEAQGSALADLEMELEAAQDRSSDLERQLEALKQEAAGLREGSSESARAQQQLDELREARKAEAEAWDLERSGLGQQLEVLGSTVTDLEAQLAVATASAAEAARVPELQAELAAVQARLDQAPPASDLTAVQERCAQLEAELEKAPSQEAVAEVAELRAANQALQSQLASLESNPPASDTGALELQLVATQGEVEALRAQLASSAGDEVAHLREELGRLQAMMAEGAPGGDRQTEQMAFEDPLTRLPNMNLLRRYLDYSLKQVDRYQRRCALIHVDIDKFGALKEALGEEGSDEVLRQVAARLQNVVRTSDVLCRKGEDDFLILLSEVAGDADAPESVSIVLKRINDFLALPIEAARQPVTVTVSIGVSQFPSDARDADEMLTNAAAAVRRAKELGRNQAQFFTEELQKRHVARATLESELRKALDGRQLQLLFQPIVHLPTGRMAGVESLLRWNHPHYGQLTPEYFLEVADETGLMNPIGRWVLAEAAAQLRDWARMGLDLFVTVNLSTRQFLQADLTDIVRQVLETTKAPAHNLVLEVPESVQMLDAQRVQTVLLTLRQAGVRVALDRFGSGFSSLERLHSELITLLKIDRKFLFHAATNAAAFNVTVAAVGLARGLRLRPVAVGVENEQQLSFCRQLECEYVQGNLIYVPAEAAQISELARAGRLLR